MSEALKILQKVWKHDSFREPQEAIIQSVLEGNDTFALLPTGGGKSVCYQVPGLVLNGITLVISPLIALMKDQVSNLQKKDIKAIALLGGLSQDEIITLLDNCQFGNYKFLYLSPERLQQDWIVERLKQIDINLIAIDEAHCVSQWGHDFRPAYLKIKNLKEHFPKVPFIALTASATKRVQQDIIENLGLEKPKVFKKSFYRDNLAYHIIPTDDKLYKIKQILTKNPQSSIIYVRNRKSTVELANQLHHLGFTTTSFHGGLPIKEKEKNMELWMRDKAQVVVATNAFGMGIDKPDVKTVIHYQLPENLENYYQEAGRAGRNSVKSFGILLLGSSDIEMASKQFEASKVDKIFLKEVYKKLNTFFRIAYGEGFDEEFSFNLNQFCAHYNFPVVRTFNALQFLDRQGIISLHNESIEKIKMHFLLPSKEIIRYISLHQDQEEIITTILRTYSGIFESETAINTSLVAKKSNTTEEEVFRVIHALEKVGCVALNIHNSDTLITFNEAREDDLTINPVIKFLEQYNNIKQQQFDSVIGYVTDEKNCNSKKILAYFDEKEISDCGMCSNCLKQKPTQKTLEQLFIEIKNFLKQKDASPEELEHYINADSSTLIEALRLLLDQNYITLNSQNQYTIFKWKN